MEENNRPRKGRGKFYIILMLATVAAAAGIRFLYRLPDIKALQTLAILIMGQIVTVFAYECGSVQGQLLSGTGRPGFFYIVYTLLILACVVFPAMPATAWPAVVIFVLLTVLSNASAGILGGCMCLFLAGSALDAGMSPVLYVYLFAGMAGSVLVAHLDSRFRVGLPIGIVEAVLITGLGVSMITTAGKIGIELFIYPAVNAVITLILIFFILKLYSVRVIFKQDDTYLELNDPECMLLTKLKNISPEDYHTTVHVVYFCDRVCAATGIDSSKVKCAGLYHRIGAIGGEYNWENTRTVCEEEQLPEPVIEILRQFEDPSVPITSAEAAVLFMSECVVSSIRYLFAKNSDIQLDYPSLIEMIFSQRAETGMFKQCDITIRQFEQMKQVFVEEKLYYDFLR